MVHATYRSILPEELGDVFLGRVGWQAAEKDLADLGAATAAATAPATTVTTIAGTVPVASRPAIIAALSAAAAAAGEGAPAVALGHCNLGINLQGKYVTSM